MKIVFLDAATLGDVSLEPISALGELVCYRTSSREEAIARVAEAEVLIVNKVRVDKTLVDAAPRLRLICEAATGVNNIDLGYAASKGIPVRNAVGYSTDSVVQTTFMMILALVGKCRLAAGMRGSLIPLPLPAAAGSPPAFASGPRRLFLSFRAPFRIRQRRDGRPGLQVLPPRKRTGPGRFRPRLRIGPLLPFGNLLPEAEGDGKDPGPDLCADFHPSLPRQGRGEDPPAP